MWRGHNNTDRVPRMEEIMWYDSFFPQGQKRTVEVGTKLIHNTCGGEFVQRKDYDEGMPDSFTVRWTCDKCGHKQIMDVC